MACSSSRFSSFTGARDSIPGWEVEGEEAKACSSVMTLFVGERVEDFEDAEFVGEGGFGDILMVVGSKVVWRVIE